MRSREERRSGQRCRSGGGEHGGSERRRSVKEGDRSAVGNRRAGGGADCRRECDALPRDGIVSRRGDRGEGRCRDRGRGGDQHWEAGGDLSDQVIAIRGNINIAGGVQRDSRRPVNRCRRARAGIAAGTGCPVARNRGDEAVGSHFADGAVTDVDNEDITDGVD